MTNTIQANQGQRLIKSTTQFTFIHAIKGLALSLLLLLLLIPTSAIAQTDTANDYALPFEWKGDATIAASDLATTAPPLEAEVSEGDFQLSYVPVENGAVLRIQPGASTVAGDITVQWPLTATSQPPTPQGQTVILSLSARLYAPDAQTNLTLRDESGSSSVTIEGLTWADYTVARQIDADSSTATIALAWSQVPATSWLEIRNISVRIVSTPDDPAEAIALSPTDTPTPVQAAVLPTPIPPTPTPTPTPFTIATPTPLPTPTTAYIVVTSTPTPDDVFQEATRVAQATEWSRLLGPATSTPELLATPTPTRTPFIVTNTPTPENAATATQVAIFGTAIAYTTGTPTPIPAEATVLVATNTPTPEPKPTKAPKPTNTPKPLYVLLDDIPTPKPTVEYRYPPELYNKIVFLSDYGGNPRRPNPMIMNPDGTEVGLLASSSLYNVAERRDSYALDERFYVYSQREAGGAAYNAGLVQLFYDDYLYDSLHHQLTYFGVGTAWAPAFAPDGNTVALVSNESKNDEIWIVDLQTWPAIQLTKNDWEWDHHPSFSPDGDNIVFSSNRVTGRRQIWMMDADGENQRQITNFPFEAWDPVWVKYVEPPSEE